LSYARSTSNDKSGRMKDEISDVNTESPRHIHNRYREITGAITSSQRPWAFKISSMTSRMAPLPPCSVVT